MLRTMGRQWGLILLLSAGLLGCSADVEDSLNWLFEAESRFSAHIEGTTTDSLRGEATFRTDEEGRLVGIELNKTGQSMRGLSIELEPRISKVRTYTAVEPILMGVERSENHNGFVAYLESEQGSYTAAQGTLEVIEASASSIRGRFDLWMRGSEHDTGQPTDVTVSGSFQATPHTE